MRVFSTSRRTRPEATIARTALGRNPQAAGGVGNGYPFATGSDRDCINPCFHGCRASAPPAAPTRTPVPNQFSCPLHVPFIFRVPSTCLIIDPCNSSVTIHRRALRDSGRNFPIIGSIVVRIRGPAPQAVELVVAQGSGPRPGGRRHVTVELPQVRRSRCGRAGGRQGQALDLVVAGMSRPICPRARRSRCGRAGACPGPRPDGRRHVTVELPQRRSRCVRAGGRPGFRPSTWWSPALDRPAVFARSNSSSSRLAAAA